MPDPFAHPAACATRGGSHVADGGYATIGGGQNNLASGSKATVPGGWNNEAVGDVSFAAGHKAWALHKGTFVWADDSAAGASFSSTADNQFLIRAAGGVGIGTNTPDASTKLHVERDADTYAYLATTDYGVEACASSSGGYFYNASTPSHCAYLGGTNFGVYGYGTSFGVWGATTSGRAVYGYANAMSGTNYGVYGKTSSSDGYGGYFEGNASKTTAGDWLANSDGRIKTDVRTISNALETLDKVRLVSFRYTNPYRAEHPDIKDAEIAAQREQVADLSARLGRIEALLAQSADAQNGGAR